VLGPLKVTGVDSHPGVKAEGRLPEVGVGSLSADPASLPLQAEQMVEPA